MTQRGLSKVVATVALCICSAFTLSGCASGPTAYEQRQLLEGYELAVNDALHFSEDGEGGSVTASFEDGKVDFDILIYESKDQAAGPDFFDDIINEVNTVFQDAEYKLGLLNIEFKFGDETTLTIKTDADTIFELNALYRQESGYDLAKFGQYIFDVMGDYSSFKADYSTCEIEIDYEVKNNGGVLAFSNGLGELGYIIDTRTKDGKMTVYDSFAELAKDFPALNLYEPYLRTVEK